MKKLLTLLLCIVLLLACLPVSAFAATIITRVDLIIDLPVADELCCLDGENEFIIYAAPVGLMDAEKNAEVNAKLYAKTIEESNAVKPLEK